MPVELLQSSKGYDDIRLGCPWLMGFAFHCRSGGRTVRKIRSGDIRDVRATLASARNAGGLWREGPEDEVSFLSGPHLAGRDSDSLVFLITLEDGERLVLRIATAPGTFEDVGAKMFRSFVTAQQQLAARE